MVLANQIVVTCKYPARRTQPARIKNHTIESVAIIPANTRFAGPNNSPAPVATRIMINRTKMGILLRTIALIKPAERVFSSSSGKTGGARNLLDEFFISVFSLIPFVIGGIANDLNSHFRIFQHSADFPDGGLQDLFIFRRCANGCCDP